jgi:spermidine/putrescine ABC transporter ATP-binding subunit
VNPRSDFAATIIDRWKAPALDKRPRMVPALELAQLVKRFGSTTAVDRIDLAVPSGELVALLGPSGCGKTTTLRIVAGFERPDSGRVRIQGVDVTAAPPYRRDTGMVFQHYALFPHMTVRENVGFGLRMRGVDRSESETRVQEALALVSLRGLEARYPRQLSGGQQQRVALARALVIRPQLLLLDEPLSSLDAKLRQEMRLEVRAIQRQVGITALFVTHDQEEALSLADRVAVINQGRIEQVGTPVEVYEQPRTAFVAGFIGQSNFFRGEIVDAVADGGRGVLRGEDGRLFHASNPLRLAARSPALLAVKDQRVRMCSAPSPAALNSLAATVESVSYLGTAVQYVCRAGERSVVALVGNDGHQPLLRPDARVWVEWHPDDAVLLPP